MQTGSYVSQAGAARRWWWYEVKVELATFPISVRDMHTGTCAGLEVVTG